MRLPPQKLYCHGFACAPQNDECTMNLYCGVPEQIELAVQVIVVPVSCGLVRSEARLGTPQPLRVKARLCKVT